MIVLLAALAAANSGLSVSANTTEIDNTRVGADCFAGVRFNNDGTEQGSTAAGVFSLSRGGWLDMGDPASVWVERIINSGTLDWTDSGAGRLQLNVTRSFGNTRTSNGTDTTNVTFDFYDAAAGGNLLATRTYDIISTKEP